MSLTTSICIQNMHVLHNCIPITLVTKISNGNMLAALQDYKDIYLNNYSNQCCYVVLLHILCWFLAHVKVDGVLVCIMKVILDIPVVL